MKMSEGVANIAAALAAFQAEVKNPANTADNPFFKSKYAPLHDILKQVRPLLAKHGLAIVQMPTGDGENIGIVTLLLHKSGEWIEACPLVLRADKTTAQGAGSAITYGRRYAVAAMLGISSEDDDDGNVASQPSKEAAQERPRPSGATRQQDPKKAQAQVFAKIHEWAEEVGFEDKTVEDVAKDILRKSYEVESCSDIPHGQWPKIAKNIDRLLEKVEGHFMAMEDGQASA